MQIKTLKRKNGELLVKVHDDGTKDHIPLKDGKEHGKAKTWYPNGQLKEQTIYKNGQEHGRYIAWHPNGQKAREVIFEDGRKTGWFRTWYVNGVLASEIHHGPDGLADGISKAFNENGEEATAVYHLNGKQKRYQKEEIAFMIHFLSNHNFEVHQKNTSSVNKDKPRVDGIK